MLILKVVSTFYYVYKHTDVPSSCIFYSLVWVWPSSPSTHLSAQPWFYCNICAFTFGSQIDPRAHCHVHVATLKSAVSWSFWIICLRIGLLGKYVILIYCITLLIALIRVPFSCKYANMHINYIWSGRGTLHTQVNN